MQREGERERERESFIIEKEEGLKNMEVNVIQKEGNKLQNII